MALKVLMLRKKIDDKKKELNALVAKDAEIEKREAELEVAINEAESDEDKNFLDGEIEKHEADKQAQADAKASLEKEISDMEEELAEEEREQETVPAEVKEETHEERGKETIMNKAFKQMSVAERQAIIEREDVKKYLGEIRTCIREKRALSNVGVTIPEVFVGLLRENIMDYSKLYKHVAVKQVNGDGRQVIMGTIPEAIWTDCCANLNELALGFNDLEMLCWKVGGFFAVCNSNLEDSDIDLASELLTVLGQAIGYALDKAILYGTGTRMPLGVVTRLAQTEAPADYSATARPWADLHVSNIINMGNVSDANLFKKLVQGFGSAKGAYSRGEIVHVMNEKTYTTLIANALTFNASGAVVSGIDGTMPVIGGAIEVLNFVPDNNIISGYFDLYTLAERSGAKFATSEHVRFLQDQTVFKGTARYDGKPAIAEAFVVQGINVAPSTTVTFASDTAN